MFPACLQRWKEMPPAGAADRDGSESIKEASLWDHNAGTSAIVLIMSILSRHTYRPPSPESLSQQHMGNCRKVKGPDRICQARTKI